MKILKKVERYSEAEREDIRAYARNPGPSFLDNAIKSHRNMLSRLRLRRTELPYGDIYFEFMREIDSLCPDYGLRAAYRRRIVSGES